MEKFINFLGRGAARPQTPLAAYGASILASSALDLRPLPLNVPAALTPMLTVRIPEVVAGPGLGREDVLAVRMSGTRHSASEQQRRLSKHLVCRTHAHRPRT